MAGGTLFRLFPQWAQGYAEPELVELAAAPGSIGPGPSDSRMYVAHAVDKREPYDPPAWLPPYRGALLPPAQPDGAGNFDHIPFGTPEFLSAHLYGVTQLVLEIWEDYLGQPVRWWHADVLPRLELQPVVYWANAQSGFGFLEAGLRWTRFGQALPLCLSFDVVAHEVGHAILFSTMGVPESGAVGGTFLAFHEAFADLISTLSVLHFPSVVMRLLAQTSGNLYELNLVSRLGELSDVEQVRVVDNTVRLRDLQGLRLLEDGTWRDPLNLGRNAHVLAAPLTGAVWDILVELFQEGLVAEGIIPPDRDTRSWTPAAVTAAMAPLRHASAEALARFEGVFRHCLHRARDRVGLAMAQTILRLDPETLSFGQVAALLIEALAEPGATPRIAMGALLDIFDERDIDPRPFLAGASAGMALSAPLPPMSRAAWAGPGAALPHRSWARPCGCHGDIIATRRMMPHGSRASAG